MTVNVCDVIPDEVKTHLTVIYLMAFYVMNVSEFFKTLLWKML